jgi:hypothetical protein
MTRRRLDDITLSRIARLLAEVVQRLKAQGRWEDE